MTLLDSYLLFLDEQKWQKLAAAGKLSAKHLKKLKHAGLVKSKEKMMQGIETGNEKLIKKLGVDVKHTDPVGAGPITVLPTKNRLVRGARKSLGIPNQKNPIIYFPKDPVDQFSFQHSLRSMTKGKVTFETAELEKLGPFLMRHELDEIRAWKRLMKTMKNLDTTAGIVFLKKRGKQPVGAHISPEVLFREKEIMDKFKILYGKELGSAFKKWEELRKWTKEYKWVEGKSKEELRKIERAVYAKDQFSRHIVTAAGRLRWIKTKTMIDRIIQIYHKAIQKLTVYLKKIIIYLKNIKDSERVNNIIRGLQAFKDRLFATKKELIQQYLN